MLTAERVTIERPAVLAAVSCVLLAVLVGAFASLWQTRSDLSHRPVLVLREQARLTEALANGPFIRTPASDSLAPAPVWLIGASDCDACMPRTIAAAKALNDNGVAVNLMLMHGPDADPEGAAVELAAVLARTGDPAVALNWREGDPLPQVLDGPEEREGYRLWAQQSAAALGQALAANGVDLHPPILVWNEAGRWRAVAKADAATASLAAQGVRRAQPTT